MTATLTNQTKNIALSGTVGATDATYPGTVVNTDGGGGTGTDPWSTVDNIKASDDVYATCSMGSGDSSDYLDATGFGFSIPSKATIVGVVVSIERKANQGTGCLDKTVQLILTTAQGTNKASASAWPAADAVATYGSSSDLWGNTLTPAVVNASDFGVRLQTQAPGTLRQASVDGISVTVYYRENIANQTLSQKTLGAHTFDEIGTETIADVGSKTFDTKYIAFTNQSKS